MNKLLIEGLPAIARACNRKSPLTIARWIKREGFPAAKLPNGQWCTTETLINQWILARQQQIIPAPPRDPRGRKLDLNTVQVSPNP